MRIALLEYCNALTPGASPPSLRLAGRALLHAVAADLAGLPGVEAEIVTGFHGGEAGFDRALRRCDAALVLAPEEGNILERLVRHAARGRRLLIGPGPRAVRLAADKWAAARCLEARGIAVPAGTILPRRGAGARLRRFVPPFVLKPRDGCGCRGVSIVRAPSDIERALCRIDRLGLLGDLLVEEYVEGEPASVSLLVSSGAGLSADRRALALPLNRQILRGRGALRYAGGVTPWSHPAAAEARHLAARAVEALTESAPDLCGYVGVDLVLAPGGPRVIEINPRLTTSYLGLRRVARANLAGMMIDAALGRPLPRHLEIRGRCSFRSGGAVAMRRAGFRRIPMAIDCGWDIGGVHLKVACLRSGGAAGPRLVCRQEAFEIWRAPARLGGRLAGLLREVLAQGTAGTDAPAAVPRHAVTMTAELSDVFPDRRSGVRAIIAACAEAFETVTGAAAPIRILDTTGELLSPEEARDDPHRVAAANWAASAGLVARLVDAEALLIDVGSTTTDIIALQRGLSDTAGRTDLERLLSGELVYTGLLRTPPFALVDRVPLGDRWCRVAPEAFTHMADVYLLLGRIGAEQYTVPTPDGRGRSRDECAARLARLVCAEPAELGSERLRALAAFLEDRQIERIADGIRQVVSRRPGAAPLAVVAGSGRFLGEAAARRAGLETIRLSGLLPVLGGDWDTMAPAAALAILLAETRGPLDLPAPGPA